MENYFDTVNLPLITIDFDYFRIPREKWELMLIRLKQMGAQAIMVALPWGFHEFNRGTIDLNGATHPRRDVLGLLNLCLALELYCILKPGPYNHQGVLADGIPLWLLNDDFETALPPAVEGWYKAIGKTLGAQQWPAGPIIALSIDSEARESQPPTYSKQLTEVRWRIWLRKRYDGLEALNENYGTDYRSVNDVKFPLSWAEGQTPLERDAKEFLEKVQSDTQNRYAQVWIEAGWQIPVYPSVKEIYPDLPAFQTYSLTKGETPGDVDPAGKILHLQQPIQVDPDPVEVGQEPFWAGEAPIRSDGSLRQKFWRVRQFLWQQALANTRLQGKVLIVAGATASLVTCSSETPLKLDVAADPKAAAYRLRLDGELVLDDNLSLSRGKLKGSYLAEDEIGQTDLILLSLKPKAPLEDFALAYLSRLLIAQAQSLTRCAALAGMVGQTLAFTSETPEAVAPKRPAQAINTLEEARRGLSEAETVLRKAMASIGGLEEGFATILDQSSSPVIPQPATAPAAIRPDIFEGLAREILVEAGAACAEVVLPLKSAATALQQTLDSPGGFTINQYRESYATAVAAARTAREPLLKMVTKLRLEIASERLPLLAWRVHDQVQEIAESLRWGVLRR